MATNLEEQLALWHQNRFGPDTAQMAPRIFRKLCEEVGELGEALMFDIDAPVEDAMREIKMEAGDVAVCLLSLLRCATGERSLQRVMAIAHDKLETRLAKALKPAEGEEE